MREHFITDRRLALTVLGKHALLKSPFYILFLLHRSSVSLSFDSSTFNSLFFISIFIGAIACVIFSLFCFHIFFWSRSIAIFLPHFHSPPLYVALWSRTFWNIKDFVKFTIFCEKAQTSFLIWLTKWPTSTALPGKLQCTNCGEKFYRNKWKKRHTQHNHARICLVSGVVLS